MMASKRHPHLSNVASIFLAIILLIATNIIILVPQDGFAAGTFPAVLFSSQSIYGAEYLYQYNNPAFQASPQYPYPYHYHFPYPYPSFPNQQSPSTNSMKAPITVAPTTTGITATPTTDPIVGALLRPKYLFPQSLTNMFKQYVDSNDVVFNGLLKKYSDQLPGFKATSHVSLADIQTYAPVLRSYGIQIVGYDLEKAFSPAADLSNPISYTIAASATAHKYGLLFMALPGYPSGRDTNYAARVAPYCDYYVIQAQAATNDPDAYQKFVTMMAKAVHNANPNTKIITQIDANLGTAQQMEQDFTRVANVVRGVVVGFTTTTPVDQLNQFFSWLHSIYGA
jgi:hypothetical protein